MERPYKAALVGCGNFARRHCRHICTEKAIDGLEISIACDIVEEKAKTFSEEYGIPRWTTRYEDVLADDGVDLVMIVTRPEGHTPLAIEALAAGKPVFSEKPMSTGTGQREQLRQVLKETGGRLMCGYCYRFAPPFAESRKVIGPAAFSTSMVLNNEAGGENYLLNNACHAVDAMLAVHSSEPRSVTAVGNDYAGQRHPKEQFIVTIGFADGSIANLVAGGTAAGSHLCKWYYKWVGRNERVAEITCTNQDLWSLYVDGTEGPVSQSDYFEGHREELRHIVACLDTGAPFGLSVESSLTVDEILAEAASQLGLSPTER